MAGLRAGLEELAEEVHRERPQEDPRGAARGRREHRPRRRAEVSRRQARGRAGAAPQPCRAVRGRGEEPQGRGRLVPRRPGFSLQEGRDGHGALQLRIAARSGPEGRVDRAGPQGVRAPRGGLCREHAERAGGEEGLGRGEGRARRAREDEEGRRGRAHEAGRGLRPEPGEAPDAPSERHVLLRAQRAHRGHARAVAQDPAGPARRSLERRELPQERARRPLRDVPHRGREARLRGQAEVPRIRPEDASAPGSLRRLELAASVRDVRVHVVPRRPRPRDGLHARRPHAERLRGVRAPRGADPRGTGREGHARRRGREPRGDGRDRDRPVDEGVRLGGRQVQRPPDVPDEGRRGGLLPMPPGRRRPSEGAEARRGPQARRGARVLGLSHDEGARGPPEAGPESRAPRRQDDSGVDGALAREPARLPQQHEDAEVLLPRRTSTRSRATSSRTR